MLKSIYVSAFGEIKKQLLRLYVLFGQNVSRTQPVSPQTSACERYVQKWKIKAYTINHTPHCQDTHHNRLVPCHGNDIRLSHGARLGLVVGKTTYCYSKHGGIGFPKQTVGSDYVVLTLKDQSTNNNKCRACRRQSKTPHSCDGNANKTRLGSAVRQPTPSINVFLG